MPFKLTEKSIKGLELHNWDLREKQVCCLRLSLTPISIWEHFDNGARPILLFTTFSHKLFLSHSAQEPILSFLLSSPSYWLSFLSSINHLHHHQNSLRSLINVFVSGDPISELVPSAPQPLPLPSYDRSTNWVQIEVELIQSIQTTPVSEIAPRFNCLQIPDRIIY